VLVAGVVDEFREQAKSAVVEVFWNAHEVSVSRFVVLVGVLIRGSG